MTAEFIEPTAIGRRRILVGLGVAGSSFTAIYFGLFAYIKFLPPCEGLNWSKAALVGEAVLVCAVVIWLIRDIWRIIHPGQYPAPGASVLFRTRIVRGWWLVLEIVSRAILIGILAWSASEVGRW
jgi:hypothetical protein